MAHCGPDHLHGASPADAPSSPRISFPGATSTDQTPFSLRRPNHVVTFLRPKPGQSPTTATFQVPLTFNKLDFRDYLYNVYNVEVNSVRAFINQKAPQQRPGPRDSGGQWYRPRAQKLMVVDLRKPFVWPDQPSEEGMEPWDRKLFAAVEAGHEEDVSRAEARSGGMPKLRTQMEDARSRVKLKDVAQDLLSGKKKWLPGTEWVETEKEEKVAEAVAAPTEKGKAKAETEPVTVTETKKAKENEKGSR